MNTRGPCALVLAAIAAAAVSGSVRAGTAPRIDTTQAFEHFWTAADAAEAGRRADEIAASGVAFDEALRRLHQGRAYAAQPAGLVRMTNTTSDGVEHHYAVTVPAGYDPAHKYGARLQLHGGIMMRHDNVPPASAGGIGALAGDNMQFYIVPFAWDAAPWWGNDQLLNLRDIIDTVKRRYNIDENRIALSGVSDGGTGAYYVAMRDTTPFASFLPLNGYWGVLANHDMPVDGPLFPGNLRNKPLFIVNGERDPLYPAAIVEPAIAHYRQMGVTLDYRPQAGAGHNTQWWPRVKDSFEGFVREHPRGPLPDTLTWETANTLAFNRAHWLVIDALGTVPGERALDDPNLIASESRLEFGIRTVGSRVNRVLSGSNAERLGLEAGDGLVRLNDETVHFSNDVQEIFDRITPGSTITLLVARHNAPVELSGVYEPQSVTDPPHPLFARGEPSGRVDLVRQGNTVNASTRGVTAFTLLVSPDQFDLSKPVTVVANGRTVFNGRVDKNLRTLLKWAAADNDRTMLFAGELHIKLTER